MDGAEDGVGAPSAGGGDPAAGVAEVDDDGVPAEVVDRTEVGGVVAEPDGRLDEASTRLQARLDRRPSPIDSRLLSRTRGASRTPG